MPQTASRDDQMLHSIIEGLNAESQGLYDELESIYNSKSNKIPINIDEYSQTSRTIYNKLLAQGFQNKTQFKNHMDRMMRLGTTTCITKLKQKCAKDAQNLPSYCM